MWSACLARPGERGCRRSATPGEEWKHRQTTRDTTDAVYVKSDSGHVLLESVWETAPHQPVQSPVEGRLVVRANDERRWRAKLLVARDAGRVETKAVWHSLATLRLGSWQAADFYC